MDNVEFEELVVFIKIIFVEFENYVKNNKKIFIEILVKL